MNLPHVAHQRDIRVIDRHSEIYLIFFRRRGMLAGSSGLGWGGLTSFRFGLVSTCLLGARDLHVSCERQRRENDYHYPGSKNFHDICAHWLSPSSENGSMI